RSTRDRQHRFYAGRIVAAARVGRGERSEVSFSRNRTAAFARDLETIPFMRRLHPRSPYEKLGGYVHLPRLIDKARLQRKGLLDGYNYKTVGFDKHLLSFLKLDGDAFEEAVHRLEKDDAILNWVQQNSVQHSDEEVDHWNQA